MKKALIIGYGSAGQRHEEILKQLGLKVFIYSRRKIKNIRFYKSLNELLTINKPEYIVIANETSEHLNILKHVQEYNAKNILVEKPIFSNVNKEALKNKDKTYIGYNLRFHPLIEKLKSIIEKEKVISIDMQVGSFLPNWRFNRDYQKIYSSKVEYGGGVLRDLSHEIDLLLWIFGPVKEIVSVGGHLSELSGDSEDLYKMIIKMENSGIASINLDYLNRLEKREITVITEQQSIFIDIRNNRFSSSALGSYNLTNYDLQKTYIDQHLDIINNLYMKVCSFDEGINVLKIIQAAERSNRKKKWVKI